MAKGALGGFLTGTVVAVIATATISVITGPETPRPDAAAVEVPAGSEFDGARDDTQASLPAADPVDRTPETPRAAEPEPDDLNSLSEDQITPGNQPEPVEAETGMIAPDTETAPLAIGTPDSGNQAPAMTSPPTAPEAPADEDLSISTTPAQPALPDDSESSDFMADDPVAAPAPVIKQPETPVKQDREPAQIIALDPDTPAERPTPLPRVGQNKQETPRIGTPAGRLTDQPSEADTENVPADTPVIAAPQSPLDAYAAPFENPEDKPLMAILLLDQGDSKIGLDALASFPYPISFAVDATKPNAKTAMKRYRDAGFEVLALSDIPLGATAADTEMLLRATLRELPQTVAVMEGDQTGLQADKAVSDQAAALLAETGHGLVLFSKGLNTAQKLAAKAGVPAVTVFRDFDGQNQSAAVIRRFLDQAAFKARQTETGVVMVGRLRAETISALLLWGLQDRASQVALAPVSAVLQAERH
ncbi:divergent polysaccharide deacetylase family protein [Thalassovita sp.]|uniref:divergent polysaccharide deacetylase family protein n=1 Tax=Thalassovita sp. TaxID=1979401 RepID=UPI002B26BA76|nr:divergent polysaccharide deacetylase family protein [Thalassovita sp.]